MAKYKIDKQFLKKTDCEVLIDAVCRYCNQYCERAGYENLIPDAEPILAILGVCRVSSEGESK